MSGPQGHFAWEYKGPGPTWTPPTSSCNDYIEALENPPLLVVSDLDRFQIHTNFTGDRSNVHEFTLETLDQPEHLRVLRQVFSDPDALDAAGARRRCHRGGGRALRADRDGAARRAGPSRTRRRTSWCSCSSACSPRMSGCCRSGSFRAALTATAPRTRTRSRRRSRRCWRRCATAACSALEDIPRFNGGLFAEIDVVAADRRGARAAGGSRRARLGQRRAGHLRDAVRALARPEQARRSLARTTPAARTSSGSSSRC